MKRVRWVVGVSALCVIAIVYFSFVGKISYDEIFKGALLGAVVSIIVSVPFEIINYQHDQKNKINDFFWKGIAPYTTALTEVFLYSKDFYFLEKTIFEKEGISRTNEEWKDYVNIYKKYKEILEPKIDGFRREITIFTEKHGNEVAFLSHLLSNIEPKTFFGRKSGVYKKCHKVYNIMENIDWSMDEIRPIMDNILKLSDAIERDCKLIVIFRWLSYTLTTNYDRGITDLTQEESENSTKEEIVLAKKDLELATFELLKEL